MPRTGQLFYLPPSQLLPLFNLLFHRIVLWIVQFIREFPQMWPWFRHISLAQGVCFLVWRGWGWWPLGRGDKSVLILLEVLRGKDISWKKKSKYKICFTLSPPITTKVPHANSLAPDEMPSNFASHTDPSCLTLEALWKLKQTKTLADDNLFAG